MNKCYFRKVETEKEDFVLMYVVDETQDKGPGFLAEPQNTEEVITKFNGVMYHYVNDMFVPEKFAMIKDAYHAAAKDALREYTEFEWNGYTICWCSYASYISAMNGMRHFPLETYGYEQANKQNVQVKVKDYYASIGQEVPADVDPEKTMWISTRPCQKSYFSFTIPEWHFRGQIYKNITYGFEEKIMAPLPSVDLVNIAKEELKSENAAPADEQGIDYALWIKLTQDEMAKAAEAFDYQKVAELKQKEAILVMASQNIDLEYYRNVLQDANNIGNDIAKKTWTQIVELAENMPNRGL